MIGLRSVARHPSFDEPIVVLVSHSVSPRCERIRNLCWVDVDCAGRALGRGEWVANHVLEAIDDCDVGDLLVAERIDRRPVMRALLDEWTALPFLPVGRARMVPQPSAIPVRSEHTASYG